MAGSSNKGKGKKAGRSRDKCKAYKARMQRWKNKIRKIKRHIKAYPGDAFAKERLDYVEKNGACR